ncbi:MAG: GTP pyrophosphokinase, partial [Terracoccus sp.]
MPTTRTPEDTVRLAVDTYASLLPELESATGLFVRLVTDLLDDAGINYLSVTGRTKSVASFAGKAQRLAGGGPLYPDPLAGITDQIGLRVITYIHDDVAAVADVLSEELAVLDDRDMGEETAREGRFGYASRHLLVAVDASRTVPPVYEPLRRRSASVQVRTVLQHAWAEFEHDIRYKGSVPEEHAPDLDRRFTLAAGLLELADREFTAIRDRLQATMPAKR